MGVAAILAHSTLPGAGSFLNGLVHPLTVPAHLLLLVAAGLLVSQPVPLHLRSAMAAVAGGGVVGLGATVLMPESEIVRGILTAWTCLVGLAGVADWPKAGVARAALAGVAAMLVALDSKPEVGGAAATVLALAGTGGAVILVIANVAFYASLRPNRFWAHVGLRVVASWIAAASLMLLAFALRGVN